MPLLMEKPENQELTEPAEPEVAPKPLPAPQPQPVPAASVSQDAVRAMRREERARLRRQKVSDFFIRVAFLVILVGVWHFLHLYFVEKTNAWSGALFPSPKQVGLWLWQGSGLSYLDRASYTPPPGVPMPKSLWEAIKLADYPSAIWATLLRLLKGYLVAIAIGIPIGILVSRFKLADKTVGWLSLGLQSLPSICWIPLALLWFGRYAEEAPILFVTTMGAVFATIVAVADGLSNVPPLYSRAGRTLGARGPRLYLSVLLPAALPAIVTGLKIGWSFAYRSLMAAELIVNAGGLGFLLQRDRDYGDADGVVATILIVLMIGIVVQGILFTPLEKKLQKLWGLNQT